MKPLKVQLTQKHLNLETYPLPSRDTLLTILQQNAYARTEKYY